jgi:hypothetical protein
MMSSTNFFLFLFTSIHMDYHQQASNQYAEKCLSEIKAKTVSEPKTVNSDDGQLQSGQVSNIEYRRSIGHSEKLNSGLDSKKKTCGRRLAG